MFIKNIKNYLVTVSVVSVFIFLLAGFYNKTEALNKPTISASKTSIVVGENITITYSSSDAESCTTNFNSSTATSGTYIFTPSASGSYTFTVNCKKTWATTIACYTGLYQYPDPLHEPGGYVTYTAGDGSTQTVSGLWYGDYEQIEYRTGTTLKKAGVATVDCNASLCDTYGGLCSSKFTNDTICYTLETKSQCTSNSSCQWLLCALQ